jgi:hypothetical protein
VAAGIYLVLLPLWWYSIGGLVVLTSAPADWIYHFFNPQVRIKPDGRVVKIVFAVAGGEPMLSGLGLDKVTYGLPMLAALVLATRSRSLKAKARALALGLGLMLLLTVPAVMMWAKLSGLQIEENLAGAAAGSRSSFFYYAFHGYAFSQPVIAVGLWLALLMLGLFEAKPKKEKTPVSRNAPCPCGSGRKYKLCCGRR